MKKEGHLCWFYCFYFRTPVSQNMFCFYLFWLLRALTCHKPSGSFTVYFILSLEMHLSYAATLRLHVSLMCYYISHGVLVSPEVSRCLSLCVCVEKGGGDGFNCGIDNKLQSPSKKLWYLSQCTSNPPPPLWYMMQKALYLILYDMK